MKDSATVRFAAFRFPVLRIPRLADVARGLADLILPPLAHDSREATAAAGLSADAWSRVIFLEAPVCDGCGAVEEVPDEVFADLRGRLQAEFGFALQPRHFAVTGRCRACATPP